MPHTPEQARTHRAKPEVKAKRRQYRQQPHIRAQAAEYARQYYLKNKEHLHKYNREYRRTHPMFQQKNSDVSHDWYINNKDKHEEYEQRNKDRRDAEYAKLAGRPRPDICDICGESGAIKFDHCHERGHFRGWLCNRCNLILGLVKDDPILLEIMAAYLREPPPDTPPPQPTLPGI